MVTVAQLAEQRIVVPRVAGSSPVSHPAAIAQSVERILGKDEVTSSILVGSSGGCMNLNEVPEDERVEITDVDSVYQERLTALGFTEGCEVCPLRKNDTTLLVSVRDCRYAIGKEVAECIHVKRL